MDRLFSYMLILLFALTGCATYKTPMLPDGSDTGASASVPKEQKVVMVILENTYKKDAMEKMPFLNKLAEKGSTLEDYHSVAHPSQPNYYALVSGSVDGVKGDLMVKTPFGRPHIGDSMDKKGKEWKVYADGFPPKGCDLLKEGGEGINDLEKRSNSFVVKHVPFLGFENVRGIPVKKNVLEFREHEFEGDYTIKRLCKKLMKEGIVGRCSTETDLNTLLKNDDLLANITRTDNNHSPSNRLMELKETYNKEKSQQGLMKLNRIALEEYYPHLTPKSQKIEGSCSKHIFDFPQFLEDIGHHKLPDFSLIVPNLEHDAHGYWNSKHDEMLIYANEWLEKNLGNFASKLPKDVILIITFDEDGTPFTGYTFSRENQVFIVILGNRVKDKNLEKTVASSPAFRKYNHYDLLRTIEAILDVDPIIPEEEEESEESVVKSNARIIGGIWQDDNKQVAKNQPQ